jgi:hypothetical protein
MNAAKKPITGGCACGAVRYVVNADPVMMLNCHCRDCQRATGSAYAPVVVVPRGAFEMTGKLSYFTLTGESGGTVERGFCPACGSRIAGNLGRYPQIVGLLAGSLDDPSIHKPTMDIFTASAHPWDHMAPDSPKFPKHRPG